MHTVGLYTLGCKVAQYETEALAEKFADEGFSVLPFDGVCDAYVINTCTVTAESDRKSRQIIRRAKRKNPNAVIAVVGCYSQSAPAEVAALGVDIIFGTENKLRAVELVREMLDGEASSCVTDVTDVSCASFEKMSVRSAPRTRAYVKIEDGCESKCSYCAIRLARGRVRSKERTELIEEIRALAAAGTREVVLTGIETGAYGRDFKDGYTLGDLIAELDRLGFPERIRISSLAPELVGEGFAEKIKGIKRLAPHFHISMQSGSDKILASMKRKYNSEMAFKNIVRLKEYFEGAEFTTDMMVGFPGESEEDFERSLAFIERVGFLDVHVFAYSARRGTEAAEYPCQISEEIKRERSRRMIELKNKVRASRLDAIVSAGKPLSVIAETELEGGEYSAHADNYAEIIFKLRNSRDVRGDVLWVRPVSHKDGIIYAEEL